MNRAKYWLAATVALSLSSISTAQSFVGTTTGAPTWNRPLAGAPPTSLSGTGTAVPFESTLVSVNVSGSYTFNLDAEADAWDTYAFLYTDPFTSVSPLANVLIGNDDSPTSLNSEFTISLTAGTQYAFVATGFGNGDFGDYTTTVTGPGTATFGAVPEPASMTALAIGGLALLRRRRSSK